MTPTVPRVSDDSKKRFPGAAEALAELDTFVTEYETRVRFRFTPENLDATELSVRDKVLLLALRTTSSARWLTWTIVDSLNHDMNPGLYLATRAHHEHTGVLAYALVRLRRYKQGDLSEGDFILALNRLLMARRHEVEDVIARAPHLEGHIEAISMMSLIDAVDKILDDQRLKEAFRDGYEWLSEFCHPNLFGQIALGHTLRGREVFFPKVPQIAEADVRNALILGGISQVLFFHCYSAIAELIGGVPPQDPEDSTS